MTAVRVSDGAGEYECVACQRGRCASCRDAACTCCGGRDSE